MIPRVQKPHILEKLKTNKLLFVQGPRRVGKRTLIDEVLGELGASSKDFDCSDKNTRKAIEEVGLTGSNEHAYLVLHEAQYLSNLETILEDVLGGTIKASLIVVCSFLPKVHPDLLEALRLEGLVVNLFAPSFYEAAQYFGLAEEERLLEERLIYGNYPSVLGDIEHAELTLREIIQEAIFTNLSANERINKGDKLMRMLAVLAFNIGDSISYNEVAERCGLDNETVERYIDLLEEAFILIRLPSFFNGHRYELKKSNAVYFADNGIRNALIANFNPTFLRNDMNELWRNYIIAERVKWNKMNGWQPMVYHWKTHTKQRMDYIEVVDNQINAYKTDWEKRKKVKFPASFTDAYPSAKCKVINRSTHWPFLTQKQ